MYFEQNKIIINEILDAKKEPIDEKALKELICSFDKVFAGRGKTLQEFDPKKDDIADILKVCLGRIGNLRAPALKKGNILYVGYNESMYNQL